ncbi:hypothetical protein BDV32DRAFT_120203 [Aspergillus pseudonomiae]|uniref:Uncharacterized protein n=1 Tax=Aspergillus pseudonomiae TaxID=1506151 RepID=A0A5N7D495_9EURO|nr:uncharacterized protein BDV37DRAFT_255801 [Aspergillus pseudonomiae]KAB8262497.1 hypothetical protein BDV32DRAFT_120203 [Aspergillus pseudonomiae]KAE8401240.1 hypothetical protein BDV37DRAFT_255801 [Aspergillus pseudonomiae]
MLSMIITFLSLPISASPIQHNVFTWETSVGIPKSGRSKIYTPYTFSKLSLAKGARIWRMSINDGASDPAAITRQQPDLPQR